MLLQTPAQRISAADFEQVVLLPQNQDKRLELIDGEVVAVVSSGRSSRIGLRIGGYIMLHVEAHGLGYVTGADGGYVVGNQRYMPDVGFVSSARQPHPNNEAYNPLAPDLAVEVLSPTDVPRLIRIKLWSYLAAGTQVWLLDPEAQTAELYVAGLEPRTLGIDDTLTGGDLLPGFGVPLRKLFDAAP